MKTTEEKKKELLDLLDFLDRANETSSDGHMPLIEVKKLLEKMGRGDIYRGIYGRLKPEPTVYSKILIESVVFMVKDFIHKEHPELKE